MAFFTVDQANALAQTTVRVGSLVEFQFEAETMRVWNGFGALDAGGHEWKGLAGLGGIEGLEETRGAVSQQAKFTLSGVSAEILAAALADTEAVQGRLVIVYLQLFDAAWQTVNQPLPIWFGLMQPPRISRSEIQESSGGQQVVTLPAENLFFGRSRPAAGRYTDRDQQTRYPGDRFFERVSELVSKSLVWPNY